MNFVENRGKVYRLMAYTSSDRWSVNQWGLERVLRSFEPIPDAEILAAQPLRVKTFALDRSASLAALVKARPAAAEPADLALMNQVPADSTLRAGQRVKWVVRTPQN